MSISEAKKHSKASVLLCHSRGMEMEQWATSSELVQLDQPHVQAEAEAL